MADENDKELELDAGSGKKKKMIIIIAVVVLLLAGVGGYFVFMAGGDEPSETDVAAALETGDSEASEEGEEGDTEGEAAATGDALYVPMPRPFRFNVPGASRDRFVEIRVQLLVRGADNEEEAKKHIPSIESTLLNVFSQANADDLATSAGKASLKYKALAEVQKELKEIAGAKTVDQILFTGFVMQ